MILLLSWLPSSLSLQVFSDGLSVISVSSTCLTESSLVDVDAIDKGNVSWNPSKECPSVKPLELCWLQRVYCKVAECPVSWWIDPFVPPIY